MSGIFDGLFGMLQGQSDALSSKTYAAAQAAQAAHNAAASRLTSVSIPPSLQQAAALSSAQKAAMQSAYGLGIGNAVYMDANGNLQPSPGHLYRHPGDPTLSPADYFKHNHYLNNTSSEILEISGNDLRDAGISSTDILEIFGGKYIPVDSMLALSSVACLSYSVPSSIIYSSNVAVSNAIDMYITQLQICTSVRPKSDLRELITMSRHIKWTCCVEDAVGYDDRRIKAESSIQTLDDLIAAKTMIDIRKAHI